MGAWQVHQWHSEGLEGGALTANVEANFVIIRIKGIVADVQRSDQSQGVTMESYNHETEPQNPESTSDIEKERRNIFDAIGDFFLKMVKGVFIFAFWKLPRFLWRLIVNIRVWRYIKSISRAIFWAAVWFVVVFGAWITFDFERVKRVFLWLRDVFIDRLVDIVIHFFQYIHSYANEIWIIIALFGSAYGLAYVSVKSVKRIRAKRKAKQESSQADVSDGREVSAEVSERDEGINRE